MIIQNALFREHPYKSKIDRWDKSASVRSRPRRFIGEDNTAGYYYPMARQPLSIHPLVQEKGGEAVKFILIQTAYKFMRDIAFVETEVINRVAQKIYGNHFSFEFPFELRVDLLSIIIDEAYHAYVALDFMQQLEKKTTIKPLEKENVTELSLAVDKFMPSLPEDLREVFELIAICIGENTLTKELFSMAADSSINQIFHQVMADHMVDEGRHSGIFSLILRELWAALNSRAKNSIGDILPHFLVEYLKPDLDISYNRKILDALSFSVENIELILSETHPPIPIHNLKHVNPVMKNILFILDRSGILEHGPTKEVFKNCKLIF